MSYYNALLDAENASLLALSTSIAIVTFLGKSSNEVTSAYGVHFPNYQNSSFKLRRAHPDAYPQYTWDRETRTFKSTPAELITDELRYRSALMMRKVRALNEMGDLINMIRFPLWSGLILQEQIYQAKKAQAQRYIDQGYPQSERLKFPYILHYAELEQISMKDAADEIAFKARMADETLSKSEFLRMKYFNAVRDTPNHEDVELLTEELRKVLFKSEL